MDKLYILDAVNYLFRSYYAIGPMTNQKGASTSALYGFIRSVQKLIKDFHPSHLVAVFDGPENKKSRQTLYADYKAHRKEAPEDLFPQIDLALQYCQHAGIATLQMTGVEADDAIGAATCFAKKKGATVYLCSSDKDLMQLVDDKAFMLHLHKNNLLVDAQKVEELYGVKPEQIVDLLAMMGDASDNIPGLPGFGPKTAAELLREFGTLDAILAHPEKVKGEKKQETLRSEKETALLSRELARLDCEVEIPQNEAFYKLKEADTEQLQTFFQEMNFLSLLKEQPKVFQSHLKPVYETLDDAAGLSSFLEGVTEIALDTETTGGHPLLTELVGVGISKKEGEAFYLPCNGNMGEGVVIAFLKKELPRLKVFGHNIKYDLHVLAHYGISIPHLSFDTLLASYLLAPGTRRHNLDEVTLSHFQHHKIPIEELIGKGKQAITMKQVAIDKVAAYCCEDADFTFRLKTVFDKELKKRGLSHLLHEIDLPLLPVLAEMEQTGIYLDEERLQKVASRLEKELKEVTESIYEEAGKEFNLNSPKQLSEVLFTEMGLPRPKRAATETATGADVLEELAESHPFARKVLTYRGLEKLRSTYVEALPEAIHPDTGRIHCTFNQSVAATGRLSCQDPNLQNIPIRSAEGKEVRSCFKPQKRGWSYLSADYSQIELRLLAAFSEDPVLLKAFQNGEDIHTYTASIVFDVALSGVTGEMRSRAKAVNFGILYGQGPYGLSKSLGISMKEASHFIETYLAKYPRVSAYLEELKEEARKTGYAKSFLGRIRPIPEIGSKNPSLRAAAERLAVNTPLQGTASDLIKKAMIAIAAQIKKRELEGKMILQIHDELVFEIPDHEIDIFKMFVKKEMEEALELSVPLEVSLSVGKNWGEC
jgi:DNA polymerase-1